MVEIKHPHGLKRGDSQLDDARALHSEERSNPSDIGTIENRFAQIGFQPNRVSKYLRAREYRKANQALLYAAKALADLSSDTQRPGSSSAPDVDRDRVVSVAASLFRIYLWCKDAFPTSRQKDEWAADVWCEACERTGASRDSFIQPELFPDSSVKLFLETKKKISDTVEVYYDFDASRSNDSRNADLASALLRDMSFVYCDNPNKALHRPYQHPVIQKAINITWFRNSGGDGLVFSKYFSPLPVPAIAFIVTTIQCCIDEWSNDSHRETSWEEEQFNTVYQSHRDALDKFRQRDDDFFEQFRSGLCKEAYKHAGVETTPPRRSDLLDDGLLTIPLPSPKTARQFASTFSPNNTPLDRPETSSTSTRFHSHSSGIAEDVLSWTAQDPRQSQLFSQWGVVYRFDSAVNAQGQSVTTLWRTIRSNKEDRVAKLEWAPGGGLGRAVIGKRILPMADLVRRDPRMPNSRLFDGPDGVQYRWKPSTNSQDIVLQDPNGNVIAFVRPTRPTRYQGLGDVYAELHFVRTAGGGVMMHPPLMDTVTVTAMLYRFALAFNL